MKEYDVIIAGASFAGLAVASKIKNKKVLLIDREDIGSHIISACGTLVKTMKKIKCEKAIIQTFDTATIHTKNKEIDIHLPEKFCTIDFNKFCKLFNKQNNAEFLKADIRKTDGKIVYTSKGNFKSDIIVDCTGWRAILASSLNKEYFDDKMLSFGIETEISYKKDDKLIFFLNPDIIKNGAAWLFPCGDRARFGIGSYKGDTKLVLNLNKFVESYNLKIGKIHGGYFCYCLKEPIVKNIFVVGCAAGQTLPLTGEGIRRSINFGLICGEIIDKIADKKITLEHGQGEYKKIVLKHKDSYQKLLNIQEKLQKTDTENKIKLLHLFSVPKTSLNKIQEVFDNWKINIIARLLGINFLANYAWKKYEQI